LWAVWIDEIAPQEMHSVQDNDVDFFNRLTAACPFGHVRFPNATSHIVIRLNHAAT
jgi:hypothetical protein